MRKINTTPTPQAEEKVAHGHGTLHHEATRPHPIEQVTLTIEVMANSKVIVNSKRKKKTEDKLLGTLSPKAL